MSPHLRPIVSCIAVLVLTHFLTPVYGQKNLLKGTVIDTAENRKLHYSIVALIDQRDSTLYRSVRTNSEGAFELTQILPGRYTLMIGYPRMADFLQDILITDTTKLDLGKIPMVTEAKLLEEVVVRAGVAIRMRGDTLEYTADSFAVRSGANVEELLKRLPGILVEKNGKIMAQGQQVKRILVDGDEFFSDDPGLALKYLQAGAVEKVQVYDEKSEQAKLSGMDDGKRDRTINLKLKKNRRNGYFGKLSAGTNDKQYYKHEAMGALFNQGLKVSVFGVAAKTGHQGLNYEELSKYVAKDYEVIDDGTSGMIYSYQDNDEAEDYWGWGLPEIVTGGAHFSNKWGGGRHKAFANYRIKRINVDGWSNSKTNTVMPDGTGFFSAEDTKEKTYQFQQKAGGSMTFGLDSFTTLKIGLVGNMLNRDVWRQKRSASSNEKGFQVNESEINNRSVDENRHFESNLLLQKRFRKEGRSFTLNFQQYFSRRTADNYAFSAYDLYDPETGTFKNSDTLNQLQRTHTPVETYALQAGYTDKFTKTFGYRLEYGWKTGRTSNLFNTYNNVNGKFADRIDSLSNDYDFTASTHITGMNLNWSKNKISVNVGGKMFLTSLDQVNNDLKDRNRRRFLNVAPDVRLNFRFSGFKSLGISYSGQTVQPSIEQLQPLRRTTDRLYTQEGNANLRPGFQQSATIYYYSFNMAHQRNFNASLRADYTGNSIVTERTTDAQNRTVGKYINRDGIVGFDGNVSYEWRHEKLNLRPSVTVNASRYGNYSVLNGELLREESYNGGVRIGLSHEWKKVMTTTYSFSGNVSIGKSNISTNKTNRNYYYSHTITNRVDLPWKLSVMSNCEFNLQPKNSVFNSSINRVQWYMSIEKKFFKDESGSLMLMGNDLLNQNTGYGRSVNGNNTYEWDRFVMKRYFMLTATWNFTRKI